MTEHSGAESPASDSGARFTPACKILAAKDHVFCGIAEEAVILSLRDGVYYGLNPVGALIWSMVQENTTYGEIVGRLLKEYNVEPDQCERDVTALLGQLSAKGLICIEHEATR